MRHDDGTKKNKFFNDVLTCTEIKKWIDIKFEKKKKLCTNMYE